MLLSIVEYITHWFDGHEIQMPEMLALHWRQRESNELAVINSTVRIMKVRNNIGYNKYYFIGCFDRF